MAEGRESSGHWGAVSTRASDVADTLPRSLLTPWSWKAEPTDLPEGQLYALNSVRLRRTHLKLTAEALGLPLGAGAEETRQLVEGHLISINR